MAVVCHHPPIPKSSGTNWIEQAGGMPRMMECVARALYWGRGVAAGDKQRAYKMAVGIVEDWAAGRRGVKPPTQAEAAAAVAEWNAKRAKARATPNR